MPINIILRPASVLIRTTHEYLLNELKKIKAKLTRYDTVYEKTPHGMRIRKVKRDVFICGNNLLGEFVVPKVFIKDVMDVIHNSSLIDDLVLEKTNNKGDLIHAKKDSGNKHTLRDYQEKYFNSLKNKTGPYLVDLQTGKGKMLRDDTLVLMYSETSVNWKRIDNINIGDVVVGRDGNPTNVIGVFPQGKVELYEIHFEDGRRSICGLDHQWYIYDDFGIGRVLTTKDILSYKGGMYIDTYVVPTPSHKWEQTNVIFKRHPSIRMKYLMDLLTPSSEDMTIDTSALPIDKIKEIKRVAWSLGMVVKETDGSLELLCNTKLKIVDICRTKSDTATCIMVDNDDSLYVVEDYIVTHNTFIANYTLADKGERIAVVIRPTYIEQWCRSLLDFYGRTKDLYTIVSGGDSLRRLMKTHRDQLPSIIIFSNRTLMLYYKEYESIRSLEELNYSVKPPNLMSHLGVGSLLIDEVHEEYLSVYKTILYSDCNLILGLSATLLHVDPFMNKMYKMLFPDSRRLSLLAYDKYIIVESMMYSFKHPRHIRFMAPGNRGYSQYKMEQSILRIPAVRRNYFNMIKESVDELYITKRKKGDKHLVFVELIDMATFITKELRKAYEKLRILRYTGDDPESNLYRGDIIVTTLGSAGTGKDIKGLHSIVATTSTNSIQANLQLIGRLRKRKDIDVVCRFLWSSDIPAHGKYDNTREQAFANKAKKIRHLRYNKRI